MDIFLITICFRLIEKHLFVLDKILMFAIDDPLKKILHK